MVSSPKLFQTLSAFVFTSIFLALAGCSGDDRLVVCPRAGVLYDASRITDFAPVGPKILDNVAYDAEIYDPVIKCDYDESVVTSDIEFNLDVMRGPKGVSGKRDFRYFVAVTELNQTVLDKSVYTFGVDFDEDDRRITEKREVKNIKVDFERLGRADLYEILIGWELTPDELAYNRNTSPFDRPNLRRFRRPE